MATLRNAAARDQLTEGTDPQEDSPVMQEAIQEAENAETIMNMLIPFMEQLQVDPPDMPGETREREKIKGDAGVWELY